MVGALPLFPESHSCQWIASLDAHWHPCWWHLCIASALIEERCACEAHCNLSGCLLAAWVKKKKVLQLIIARSDPVYWLERGHACVPKSKSSCKNFSRRQVFFFVFCFWRAGSFAKFTLHCRRMFPVECSVSKCAGLFAKMLCSLNVSLAVEYLVYARGATVQTVYASVRIMVLGSRFSIQFGKIFIFFFSRSGGLSCWFQHAAFVK